MQICKYPDKTKRRHANLSSEEYAGSQVPAHVSHVLDDDDYPPRAGPSRANSTNNANGATLWKKNFRDGEVEANNKRPRVERKDQGSYKRSKASSSSTPSYGKVLGARYCLDDGVILLADGGVQLQNRSAL
jgi:hypothetical protein